MQLAVQMVSFEHWGSIGASIANTGALDIDRLGQAG